MIAPLPFKGWLLRSILQLLYVILIDDVVKTRSPLVHATRKRVLAAPLSAVVGYRAGTSHATTATGSRGRLGSCPLLRRLRDHVSRSLENRQSEVGIVLHFLLEGNIARNLTDVLHDEVDARLGQTPGVEVLGGAVHPGDGVDVHVRADELMLD